MFENKMNVKYKILIIIAVLVFIPILFWISSLIKCEILTHKYYDDFVLALSLNTMLDEMEYFKVLNCDEKTADVYYVSKGMTNANVLTYKKNDGNWIETNWKTIWSTAGSASEVIYPYWWHFIYGGL